MRCVRAVELWVLFTCVYVHSENIAVPLPRHRFITHRSLSLILQCALHVDNYW